MTTYELYINDILCDLSSDEVITLLYQSPIFSSLDSIQSNRSYNIALPPTPTNMRAIGQAARPDVDADAPYVRLPAALYQDGVPLFTQGFAVVTDIADTINVTLTWGNADNFQPLFDANLRDLGPQLEAAGEDYIEWNEDSAILKKGSAPSGGVVSYPSVAFWGIDFGMGLSNPKYLHPAIDVWRILYCIQQAHGITIEDYQRLYGTLELPPIVPLVSKKADYKHNYAYKSNSESPISINLYFNGDDQAGIAGFPSGTMGFKNNGATTIKLSISSSNADNFYVRFNWPSYGEERNGTTTMSIYGTRYTGERDVLYKATSPYNTKNGKVLFNNLALDINEAFKYIGFNVSFQSSDVLPDEYLVGDVLVFGDFDNFEITYPNPFYVAPNLPDISQGDFILAMMNMQGLFAYADKDNPNTIKLISIDDIIANVQNNDIIDWSDRVILNDIHRVDMPDTSVFTIDDLAQSNILDYDNDDDVKTDTHGTITIRNENIEKEAELVELPFSASENATTGGVNCAVVPIYEDDGKGGANYSECSPRILAWKDDQTYNSSAICTGRFDPWMKFGGENGIVKTRYASYQKVVDRLRIITIRAKLTALDLYNLDYTKPVYIAQFGQIFAIYSVETGEDGICDCQLLKLKVDGVVTAHYYLYLDGQNADQSKTDITSAGTTITYSVQSNGTPYVVSKDSRLTVTIQTAEESNIFSLSDMEQGAINNGTGVPAASNTRLRSKSFQPISGEYISVNSFNDIYKIIWLFYDEEYSYINDPVSWDWITSFPTVAKIPKGAVYVKYTITTRNGDRVLTPDDAKEDCLIMVTLSNTPPLSWSDRFININIPENISDAEINYDPVILGISEADHVRREISISQKGKEYYLTLNGHSSDFSIDATADGEVIELTCATNGTPRIQMFEGDAIDSVDIQGDIISIATILNPSPVLREAIVVVELEEDPAISITVTVKQAAAVIPSIAFNPNLPWSSSAQTVTILNNGNVPLSIVSVPSFISNAGLPISLAPRAQTTRRISANNTGVPRLGTISMEYSDALGQIKTYNVSVKQNA